MKRKKKEEVFNETEIDTQRKDLIIFHLNVRSLKKHLLDLESLIFSLDKLPHIICLTETWLCDDDEIKQYLLPGFRSHIQKSRTSRGVGVMIQTTSSCKILKEKSINFEESVFAEIEFSGAKLNLAVIYNKPRENKMKFVDNLNTFLETNQSPSFPLIICCDFNIDTLQENALSKNYLNCISSNGYEIFAKSATRETDTSSTCLDHFVYQNINLLNCEILKNQTFSDHDPIILTCGLCLEPEGKTTFRNTAFLKNPSTVENYVETLRVEISECSGKLLSATTCSEAFNVFNETFLKVTDRFAPICNFPPKKNLLPKWLNESLLKIRSKRNQAHRKWKKDCHNQAKLQEFKKWRLTFEKEYKKSKKQYYQNKLQACQTDSRRTYKLLNDINGKSKTFNDPPLLNTCRQNYKLPSIKTMQMSLINSLQTLVKDLAII